MRLSYFWRVGQPAERWTESPLQFRYTFDAVIRDF